MNNSKLYGARFEIDGTWYALAFDGGSIRTWKTRCAAERRIGEMGITAIVERITTLRALPKHTGRAA